MATGLALAQQSVHLSQSSPLHQEIPVDVHNRCAMCQAVAYQAATALHKWGVLHHVKAGGSMGDSDAIELFETVCANKMAWRDYRFAVVENNTRDAFLIGPGITLAPVSRNWSVFNGSSLITAGIRNRLPPSCSAHLLGSERAEEELASYYFDSAASVSEDRPDGAMESFRHTLCNMGESKSRAKGSGPCNNIHKFKLAEDPKRSIPMTSKPSDGKIPKGKKPTFGDAKLAAKLMRDPRATITVNAAGAAADQHSPAALEGVEWDEQDFAAEDEWIEEELDLSKSWKGDWQAVDDVQGVTRKRVGLQAVENPPEDPVGTILVGIDSNGDGQLSRKEVKDREKATGEILGMKGLLAPKFEKAFARADTDQDGFITRAELAMYVQSMVGLMAGLTSTLGAGGGVSSQ